MGSAVTGFVADGKVLRYEGDGIDWAITPERILSVGEATIDSPVSGEDWLLCFVTDLHGNWLEGSLYAPGRNAALHWLSVHLQSSFEVKLANAPGFRSRVMWPPRIREQPFFLYQVSPLRRLLSRSLHRLGFPPPDGVQSVHPAVLDYLRGQRRR
mgnify:FL=1